MRIAMLAPISWRTPPRQYGPWELVTSLLTEALVARGVDVTLFATADSLTHGRLRAIAPAPYSEDTSLNPKVWEILHVAHVFEHARDFDLIHNQADYVPLAFSHLVDTPMITTIHGFSSPTILPAFQKYQDRVGYVAISEADRHESLRYLATIHHGIDIGAFPFNPAGGDKLLFYGRIHHDKGAAEAIKVALASGLPLEMTGIIHDQRYFDSSVAPFIGGKQIVYNGPVGGAARAETLGRARALLHLINFDEPFGLSVVEAMSCGTPVIAMRRGSMPELIEDGVNGFLVDSLDEAVEAVNRAASIDRAACRRIAEQKFSVRRMTDEYFNLYQKILSG